MKRSCSARNSGLILVVSMILSSASSSSLTLSFATLALTTTLSLSNAATHITTPTIAPGTTTLPTTAQNLTFSSIPQTADNIRLPATYECLKTHNLNLQLPFPIPADGQVFFFSSCARSCLIFFSAHCCFGSQWNFYCRHNNTPDHYSWAKRHRCFFQHAARFWNGVSLSPISTLRAFQAELHVSSNNTYGRSCLPRPQSEDSVRDLFYFDNTYGGSVV